MIIGYRTVDGHGPVHAVPVYENFEGDPSIVKDRYVGHKHSIIPAGKQDNPWPDSPCLRIDGKNTSQRDKTFRVMQTDTFPTHPMKEGETWQMTVKSMFGGYGDGPETVYLHFLRNQQNKAHYSIRIDMPFKEAVGGVELVVKGKDGTRRRKGIKHGAPSEGKYSPTMTVYKDKIKATWNGNKATQTLEGITPMEKGRVGWAIEVRTKERRQGPLYVRDYGRKGIGGQ